MCLLPLALQERCQPHNRKASRLKALALHAPAAQALSANPAAWLLGLAALVAGTALAAFLVAAVPTLLVRTCWWPLRFQVAVTDHKQAYKRFWAPLMLAE